MVGLPVQTLGTRQQCLRCCHLLSKPSRLSKPEVGFGRLFSQHGAILPEEKLST